MAEIRIPRGRLRLRIAADDVGDSVRVANELVLIRFWLRVAGDGLLQKRAAVRGRMKNLEIF